MVKSTQPTLNLSQALETLSRMQTLVPPPLVDQLADVAAVLQNLSAENTYLNTLLIEGEPPPLPPAAALPRPESETFPPLFGGMNDALRPPLVAIHGRADMLRAGLLGQITTEQDLWLQAIEDNTQRALGVLDSLQEIIALQKGEVQLEIMNFISTDLLTAAWERIRDRIRPYAHEVSIHAPDVVPLAQGDFYHSLTVITDLLDNAIRYTPPKGQIRLSVDNLGSHTLFSVTDNGVGLTPDDLKNVGRLFWRGSHHRLVRQHPGTGLRLYIAKQLLAMQGGELIFSGEPGLGSTFSFALKSPD